MRGNRSFVKRLSTQVFLRSAIAIAISGACLAVVTTPATAAAPSRRTQIYRWANANYRVVETLNAELSLVGYGAQDAVKYARYGVSSGCPELGAEAVKGAHATRVPSKALEAQWSTILFLAGAISSECTHGIATRSASDINAMAANLPKAQLGIVAFTKSVGLGLGVPALAPKYDRR